MKRNSWNSSGHHSLSELPQTAEVRPRSVRVAGSWRNGHESLHCHVFQRGQSRKRLFNVLGQKTGFRLFFSHIDLEQYALPKSDSRGTSIDFRRQFDTVDGMNQFKDSDDRPHFSPLELADKVPRNPVSLHRLYLRQGLLQAVFAGNFEAPCDRVSDTFGRNCLCRRHQPYIAFFPAGFPYGALHAIEYECETIPD
jgi:hypothetical protein